MGVDTRILIKITDPASWLDRTQLRQFSAKLVDVIGVSNFLLQPERDQHAISFVMDTYAKYPEEYEEITGRPYSPDAPAIFGQDSSEDPYIFAKENEQFLEVNMFLRYFSEGYARGDWAKIFFTIMWCKLNIPNCEVWYGGDSSGCIMELMNMQRLDEITYFYLKGGSDAYWMNRKCEFKCEFCQVGVVHSGGGGNCEFYHCDSCGGQWYVKVEGRGLNRTRQVTHWGDEKGENRWNSDFKTMFTMGEQVNSGERTLYPFDGTFRKTYKTPKQTAN